MSTPQLENGYLKIACELAEAFSAYRIPGEQMQALWVIIRKTYGYNKLEDNISNGQFCKSTGLKKQNVNRAINELVRKNIVIKNDDKRVPSYRFNKKYNEWKLSSKKTTVIKTDSPVIKTDDKLSSKVIPTKEKKDIIQKKDIEEIVSYLNIKTGKSFKPTTKKTKQLIFSRVKEGFTVNDFKEVVDIKAQQWVQDEKMNIYLRPETLFGTKFESYLNEKTTPLTPKHPIR